MRFAGTWKQYSKNAIIQLTTIAANSGALRYFRCPYHAMVMKMLEHSRSRTVFMAHKSYHGRKYRTRHGTARCKSEFSQNQCAGDHVMQRLFFLRECGHDIADGERNHSADDFREEAATSVPDRQRLPLQAGLPKRHRYFAECGLTRRTFHPCKIQPLRNQAETNRKEKP